MEENITQPTISTDLPALSIEVLSFRKNRKIFVPRGDRLAECELTELLSIVSIQPLEEIKSHWEERNIIDAERNFKYGIIDLDDENLARTLRWYLRGMSIAIAVWKVRSDLVRSISTSIKSKAKILKKQGVNGFKIRTRVVGSSQPGCSEEIAGWKGTIVRVEEEYCFVRFDLDPQEIDGSEKTWQLSYDCLSILRPDPPKLKQNKEVTSRSEPLPKPILKAEKSKIENFIDSPEKANLDIDSEQNKSQPPLLAKEEPKPVAKVEYTMAELVENVKLSKTIDSPPSQDKLSYTAIELAEKLNVSRAKIYQMRSSGTLEAAGYRVESSGRSLSFVPISQVIDET
jgi:hypothetical protein